jgi:hypothetical protein
MFRVSQILLEIAPFLYLIVPTLISPVSVVLIET